MSTEIVTPETLTFEDIKKWDGPTMKKYMQEPLMREAIYRVVQSQSLEAVEAVHQHQNQPTEEEVAAKAAADEAEAVRVAAEIEAAQVAARAAEEAAKNKKIVLEYQVKDEDGNPLGRPTHLEAVSEEEMRAKIIEAHVQATRAFHRLKKQKVTTFKDLQPHTPTPVAAMSDAELLAAARDLKSDDPKVALEAHRKLNDAETKRIQAEADEKLAATNELRRQEQASYQFLRNHPTDFNNCQANVLLIKEYFESNQLPWTLDNLEIAFHALESELAPVVPVAPAVPANPAPAPAPVVSTQVVAPVVQPPPTAPAQPVVPNPAPAAPRPGVNGGIIPGQTSAVRPAAKSSGLTMAEIHSWDGPTMRAKMRNPQQRAEIERVIAEAQATKRK